MFFWGASLKRGLMFWRRLNRFFHTIRYLRFAQFVYRFLFEVKFLLYKKSHRLSQWLYEVRSDDFLHVSQHEFLLGKKNRILPESLKDISYIQDHAQDILSHTFNFLNIKKQFVAEIDWHIVSTSRLWRFHLHYFDYVRDLGMAYWLQPNAVYYEKFKFLVTHWIDKNPVGQLDGWHPYTLSLRVVNWIYAWELFYPVILKDKSFTEKILCSIYLQARFLEKNLEYQSGGNHLLANAKALMFCGAFFNTPRAKKWLQLGWHIFQEELDKQILADGGHYERSPGYHWVVMNDVIECSQILKKVNPTGCLALVEILKKMHTYAHSVVTPDGGFPLMNDSALDQVRYPRVSVGMAQVIASGGVLEHVSVFAHLLLENYEVGSSLTRQGHTCVMPESGYFVFRSPQQSVMVIDCGPVCPDDLPAHAHADTLSYEFWLEGVGFITDSGVFEYTPGTWRDFFRSSSAHNTAVVDTCNQSDVWGGFRVAQRAYPRGVVCFAGENASYFSGSHDGYRNLPNPVWHKRRILYLENMIWLVLDVFDGVGQHDIQSFIHLHPLVQTLAMPDSILASRAGKQLSIYPFGFEDQNIVCGQEDPPMGWYASEFGIKEPRTSIQFFKKGRLPVLNGYVLVNGVVPKMELNHQFHMPFYEHYEIDIGTQKWSVEIDVQKSEIHIV